MSKMDNNMELMSFNRVYSEVMSGDIGMLPRMMENLNGNEHEDEMDCIEVYRAIPKLRVFWAVQTRTIVRLGLDWGSPISGNDLCISQASGASIHGGHIKDRTPMVTTKHRQLL